MLGLCHTRDTIVDRDDDRRTGFLDLIEVVTLQTIPIRQPIRKLDTDIRIPEKLGHERKHNPGRRNPIHVVVSEDDDFFFFLHSLEQAVDGTLHIMEDTGILSVLCKGWLQKIVVRTVDIARKEESFKEGTFFVWSAKFVFHILEK